MCGGVSASLYSQHIREMARVKGKQGKGGKKVDAGKVSEQELPPEWRADREQSSRDDGQEGVQEEEMRERGL